MAELNPLFRELALILVTAGVITVIFKWLKQPLVLGYIVAGFFIGPHFPWFPIIKGDENLTLWSEIGIVFLMFALGLEFSIKKLKKVGGTGAITAFTELALMFLIGNVVGRILGFSTMEGVFLGCMLSISSTTIIIKSFDDLKLKQQKFTSTVTGVLVVEDLIAVLLLVILGTLSVSKTFDGGQLGMKMLMLGFFLIVWFTFGIFLIPTFLRWMRRFMTEEILCIVAVGLCFGMVVLADAAGFSTALGAFVMGAILAETIEADVIHRVVTPIKNLFGAVFFVSVGMLVDPAVLAKYWLPVLVIALTVVLFKSLSATLGVVLSGRPLRTAMQSGFCFCQIGEFSFIIAGLGLSYGVIRGELYPIIVSVSIITTFVTPYMIKAGLPAYEFLWPRLPLRWREGLERYASQSKSSEPGLSVRQFMKKQFSSIVIYGVISVALLLLSMLLLKPLLNKIFVTSEGMPSIWGNLVGLAVTISVMAPFLWALALKNLNRQKVKDLLEEYRYSQAVVVPVILLRYFLVILLLGIAIGRYISLAFGIILVLAIFMFIVVRFSGKVNGFYKHIETRFLTNFNSRQAQTSFKIPPSMEHQFSMERVGVTQFSKYVGVTLLESGFRQNYGVNVVSIERGERVIDLPPKETVVMPLDRLTVIGTEEQISRFRSDLEVEPSILIRDHSDNELNIYRYVVVDTGPLVGKTLSHSDFQQRHHGMIIAIQRDTDYIVNPPASTVFQNGDIVWFVSPDEISLRKFIDDD
ncbi:MAG: cation:proton antiporter [Bacteroidales bacterium]|nr:cation:proton antiporter [Bacteroidales bacterium]